MAAGPPPPPVPHPAVLVRREAQRIALMASDSARQAAIEELAESLGIPAREVIPGAYVETIKPNLKTGSMVARPLPKRP